MRESKLIKKYPVGSLVILTETVYTLHTQPSKRIYANFFGLIVGIKETDMSILIGGKIIKKSMIQDASKIKVCQRLYQKL